MKNLTILVLLSLSFGQFQPQTKAELQAAVDMWADSHEIALSTYGEINTWDVSLITDMNYLFHWKSFEGYSDNIGNWDVSNVTNMEGIFDASGFNGDISNWDVSNVTNMHAMFRSATQFSHDLSSWDVTNVINMYKMFSFASSFTGNGIKNWNVSKSRITLVV